MTTRVDRRLHGRTSRVLDNGVFAWRVDTVVRHRVRLSVWAGLTDNNTRHKINLLRYFSDTINPGQWDPWVRIIPTGENE